jgi:hypothetical protein
MGLEAVYPRPRLSAAPRARPQGLILKDFTRIRKNANALGGISQAAAFRVHRTPRYMQYTQEFQAAAAKVLWRLSFAAGAQ